MMAQVPTLTSFSPASGPVGTSVIITGTNFSTTPASNIVFFGATKATVTAATTTQLTVTVPVGATYQPITVLTNSLLAYSSKPFVVTFNGVPGIDANSFAAKVDFTTGTTPYGIAIGDLDGDGKPDLAVTNNNGNTISVFKNTSSTGSITASAFATKVDFTTGAGTTPYDIAIGDLDGDGKLDLAVTSYGSNTVSVFKNTSSIGLITTSSFAPKVDFTTGSSPYGVAIGDLDGDGKPDLAVASYNDNTVSVLKNISATGTISVSSFAAKVDFTTDIGPYDVALNDLDVDGKPELVISNANSNSVSVFKNTSSIGSITSSSFATKVDFTTGSTPYSVAIGDLDGDGKPDLTVLGNSNAVSVLKNTSTTGAITSSSFAPKVDYASSAEPRAVVIGDLDGDGKPDLAVTSFTGNAVSILKNTSITGAITSGSFSPKVDFTTGSQPYGVFVCDLDGDGKTDLAVTSSNSNTVSVFRNTVLSIPAPAITSFTPTSAGSGSTVTLTGTNLTGATAVSFGGTAATSFNVVSATSITAVVASGTSGSVSVTTPGGTATLAGFAFIPAPTITSFTPTIAGNGSTVTLTGTNLTGATAVSFGGTAATSFNVVSATSITAVVGSGTSGSVSVTTPGGTATLAGFAFIPAPTITSFTPTSAGNGTTVTLTGTNLTGATAVSFGGTSATSFNVVSATSITAVVGSGTSGNVSVTTPGGTATLAGFTFIPAPTVTSFTPTSAGSGTTVTLTGTNLTGATAVSFGGTAATSFNVVSATSITAVVASGTSGSVSVTTPGGTATLAGFTFVPAPTITSFTPTSGTVGTSVTITGTNFSATQANNTVKFNGITATVTASTATSFTTSVPTDATTGAITVTVAGVTGTSATNFTVTTGTDTTPPIVTANNTLSVIAPNSSISVSANFTDASGIATNPAPRVFYRPIAGVSPNTFVSANMTLSSGSTYTATIPGSAVTELGVEYKYLITDGAWLDNSASQIIYKTRINHSAGLSLTSYPANAAGPAASNYRIIAIPLVLVSKTANDVFNNVLGGYDPTIWRMFKYNGSSFTELNASSVLTPGEGYWFITISSSPLDTGPGTTVDGSTSSPFSITLKPGWNQIGNPYNFNISWADIVAANPAQSANLGGNESKIRVFRGTIENVDVLKTFEGGFVKYLGTSATAINIPVTKNASIQGRKGSVDPTTNSLAKDEWEIFFTLKNGSTEYKLGGIGMHPEAKEDFDYHDDFNSPRFIEYLEVTFPKKYVGMTYTKDVVPTAENRVWEFKVESNLKEEITSINWDNSYFGNGKEIFLLDVASHRATEMNSKSHYDFKTATSKDFKIVFGSADYVKQELMPNEVILFEPYPNPFNNQVLIEYALPTGMVESNLEVEILNSLGSKISSVPISQKAGFGSWMWECDGQAMGLYFVRLKAGDQYIIKKLLKN